MTVTLLARFCRVVQVRSAGEKIATCTRDNTVLRVIPLACIDYHDFRRTACVVLCDRNGVVVVGSLEMILSEIL